VTDCGG